MVKKRGNLFTDNLGGLIISVAGVIILSILFFKLLAPSYDVLDRTAEGYSSSLERAIKEADDYGFADFSPIAKISDDEFYFLVYFGNGNVFTDYKYDSQSTSTGRMGQGGSVSDYTSKDYITDLYYRGFAGNTICICYTQRNEDSLVDSKDSQTVGTFTVSNYYNYVYQTDSNCMCTDLEWPAEFKSSSQENIYDLRKSTFLIRKGKDTDSQTKYFFEVDGESAEPVPNVEESPALTVPSSSKKKCEFSIDGNSPVYSLKCSGLDTGCDIIDSTAAYESHYIQCKGYGRVGFVTSQTSDQKEGYFKIENDIVIEKGEYSSEISELVDYKFVNGDLVPIDLLDDIEKEGGSIEESGDGVIYRSPGGSEMLIN